MFLPPFSPRVKSLRLVPTLKPTPPAWRYTRSDASPKSRKEGRDKDSHKMPGREWYIYTYMYHKVKPFMSGKYTIPMDGIGFDDF